MILLIVNIDAFENIDWIENIDSIDLIDSIDVFDVFENIAISVRKLPVIYRLIFLFVLDISGLLKY